MIFFRCLKFHWFLQRNLNSGEKKAFLGNKITWYTFYRKFTTFIYFKKNQVFFQDDSSFFPKNPNLLRFEKSYYFSHILDQIFYDLMIIFFMLRSSATSCHIRHYYLVETYEKRWISAFWVNDFPSIFQNWWEDSRKNY